MSPSLNDLITDWANESKKSWHENLVMGDDSRMWYASVKGGQVHILQVFKNKVLTPKGPVKAEDPEFFEKIEHYVALGIEDYRKLHREDRRKRGIRPSLIRG